MRRLSKFIIAIIIIVLLILIFVPPVLGIYIQRNNQLGFIWQDHDGTTIKTTVLQYHRGWFTSEALTQVELSDTSYLKNLKDENLKFNPENLKISFVLKSKMYHGPIFYKHFSHIPPVGLVANVVQIESPKNQGNLAPLKSFEAYINFNFSIYNHIELGRIQFNSELGKMSVDGIEGNLWHNSSAQHYEGNLDLSKIEFDNNDSKFSLPKARILFDMEQDKHGFWVGTNEIMLSEMTLKNAAGGFFSAKKIDVSDTTDNTDAGYLGGKRSLDIEKLQVDDESLGPLHLQVSIAKLNAEAIRSILDTYQKIATEGELYESQLRTRILALLPTIINSGTKLSLDKFSLATQRGNINVTAEVSWNKDYIENDSLLDLMNDAHYQADLRVSAKLLDQIIRFMASSTYLDQLEPADRQSLMDRNTNLVNTANQYIDTILGLANTHQIPDDVSQELISMVQNKVPADIYALRVKEIQFTSKLSEDTALLLRTQYGTLMTQYDALNKEVNQYQQKIIQQSNTEINQLLSKGLIIKENDDYVVSAVRDKGEVKVNGKPLKEPLLGS